jgi:hypothetical protein
LLARSCLPPASPTTLPAQDNNPPIARPTDSTKDRPGIALYRLCNRGVKTST